MHACWNARHCVGQSFPASYCEHSESKHHQSHVTKTQTSVIMRPFYRTLTHTRRVKLLTLHKSAWKRDTFWSDRHVPRRVRRRQIASALPQLMTPRTLQSFTRKEGGLPSSAGTTLQVTEGAEPGLLAGQRLGSQSCDGPLPNIPTITAPLDVVYAVAT